MCSHPFCPRRKKHLRSRKISKNGFYSCIDTQQYTVYKLIKEDIMNRNLHNLNQLMKNINLKNLLCGQFKKPILILSLFSFRLFRLPEES